MPKGGCYNKRGLTARKNLPLSVHLDYNARVIQHTDNCPLRPEVGAVFAYAIALRIASGPAYQIGPYRNS